MMAYTSNDENEEQLKIFNDRITSMEQVKMLCNLSMKSTIDQKDLTDNFDLGSPKKKDRSMNHVKEIDLKENRRNKNAKNKRPLF